jgi:hypothetical protein
LWRYSNTFAAVLAGVVAVNVVLLLIPCRRDSGAAPEPMFAASRARWVFAAIVLWIGACTFGSYWLPGAGDRVGTRAAHDYVKHHAVMLSLERDPLPLRSAFFAAEPDVAYHYYHYHYLIPAALRKLTHDRVSIGLAFGLSSAVLAAALLALVFLIARAIIGSESGALCATACASIVGGWDAVPVAIRVLTGSLPRPPIVLDAWEDVAWRVHNLATQFVWCPQHVAALVGIALCAWWLHLVPRARWWIALGPLIGASIFGSSVYLAMTAFAAAGVYSLLTLNEARRAAGQFGRQLAVLLAIAVLGAALMALQALEYREMSGRFSGGLTLQWAHNRFALLGRLAPAGPVANLLDAPWMLLVNFGLPALACLLVGGAFWSDLWRNKGTRLLLLAAVIGTVALYTVRSDINPIDYSFRVAVMPANLLACICAGALFAGYRLRPAAARIRKPLLVIGLLLGAPVGLYEAPLMAARTFLLSEPHEPDAGAIRFLRRNTPPDAVVQPDPRTAGERDTRRTLPQLIDRRMAVADPDDPHVRVFTPPDLARMQRVFADVERAFKTDSSETAHRLLRVARVTHVLLGSTERRRFGATPQFGDPAFFETVYDDDNARVVRLVDDARPGTTQPASEPP